MTGSHQLAGGLSFYRILTSCLATKDLRLSFVRFWLELLLRAP
jgi:hypothetical protein